MELSDLGTPGTKTIILFGGFRVPSFFAGMLNQWKSSSLIVSGNDNLRNVEEQVI